AHYDAISETPWEYTPGADDNASGVAGVMEAARILSDQDLKHTVKFVLFGGEELGLFGSKYYVNQVADAETEDMILGVLNLDMMAYEGNGIPEVDIHCHPWLEESAEQAEMLTDIIDVYGLDLIADIHTKDATTRSDHASFWPELIPAMLLIEDYFGGDSTPFYHTTDDRISTLDTDYLTEGVKISVVWTATMAQSDAFNPAIMENPYPDEVILFKLTTHQTDAIVWMNIKTPYRITPAVYNMAGQKVKVFTPVSPSVTRQRIRLDLSGLGAGVYWIGVPGTPVEKFVLIR
ncbi:M20/M25/M40 family metallo-hydrolase, partial [candidate division WOR-3 bacterium]|nr:M20/M25/M40 family metallo-hydrolase [candidate division WOR-3 bacterium]MBD3365002.1 M20/M25/M40 family metallo-hydrolase [candidate division WOR-3 bacterium]